MAALTIRNVDNLTKQALRIRAAQHGVSMEEEARQILRGALARVGTSSGLGQRLRDRFAEVGDEEGFVLPERRVPRMPPKWEDPA